MELKLDHIAIPVNNVEESLRWYLDNIDCKVLKHYEDWCTLLVGDAVLSLVEKKKGGHPPHIAFKIKAISDFPCRPDQIREHRDGSLFYYQEALDGNIIEWIYWPRKKQ